MSFRLHGFPTQNSLKALYVLEEIGADFEFQLVNLGEGEHKSAEFAEKTPFGKVPVLEHDGECLSESGAICRYVASVAGSPLYPTDKMQRARVDQWMDYFSCHLGRWLNTLFFEVVVKPKFGMGEPDEAAIEEANKFGNQQMGILDAWLGKSEWLVNDAISIADLFAFAYVEQYAMIDFSLGDYPNVVAWLQRIEARDSIAAARARLPDIPS